MKTRQIKLTPEWAKQLLENNTANRPINRHKVDEYCEDMLSGRWKLSHQGIAITQSKIMIDGQHRCLAVIKANKTIDMLLSEGLEEDLFSVVDTGMKRGHGQMLATIGAKNYNNISAAISYYMILKHGYAVGGGAVSRKIKSADIVEFYRENERLLQDTFGFTTTLYTRARLLSKSHTMGIILHLYLSKGNPMDLIQDFFLKVHAATRNDENPPTKLLFDVLLKDVSHHKKMLPSIRLAYVIKAWNAFKQKKAIKILKYSSTDEYPEFL